jgi:MATE family multidrug resistance protein
MPDAIASNPWRTELRATLQLAVPLAAANLLQMAVWAIDVIFVARLGQHALAASSLAVSLYGMLMWAFGGLCGACAPLIAAELGRARHAVREVRRSVRMALWLAVALGLIGLLIGLAGERIMLLGGQDPALSRDAGAFVLILMLGLIPALISTVLRVFAAALGRPFFATAISGLAILVNALGNYALIYGHFGAPQMGLMGSAWSSVITGVAMMLAYAALIQSDRRLRRYRIFGRWWRPEWKRLNDIVKIGIPIALTVLAEAGLFSIAAFLMGILGAVELAAHTIALQIAAFAFQIPYGVGQAVTIRVGYHFGAGNRVALGRAGWVGIGVALGFSSIAALIMILMPHFVMGLYVDVSAPANAAMVALCVQYMLVAAAFQLFDGAQVTAAGALRGVQDTQVPMNIAIASYWIAGFGTAVGLGFYTPLSGVGVWIGLAVGLVVAAVLLTWRWHWRERLGLVPG